MAGRQLWVDSVVRICLAKQSTEVFTWIYITRLFQLVFVLLFFVLKCLFSNKGNVEWGEGGREGGGGVDDVG